MKDKLRVRAYNVRFGDAILVSVPEKTADGDAVTRHILIDVGNVLTGAGGDDLGFKPAIDDIVHEVGDTDRPAERIHIERMDLPARPRQQLLARPFVQVGRGEVQDHRVR